jgi:Arc/MetJ family transcription regulator
MRTTLNIDDELLGEAQRITGMTEKGALVREGLRALIERETIGATWRQRATTRACAAP